MFVIDACAEYLPSNRPLLSTGIFAPRDVVWAVFVSDVPETIYIEPIVCGPFNVAVPPVALAYAKPCTASPVFVTEMTTETSIQSTPVGTESSAVHVFVAPDPVGPIDS